MNSAYIISLSLATVFLCSAAYDNLGKVKQCLHDNKEACFKDCIDKAPEGKRSKVRDCLNDNQLGEEKTAMLDCLKNKGFSESTDCFKIQIPSGGAGHGNNNNDANDSQDYKKFKECSKNCMMAGLTDCTNNCGDMTSNQRTALFSCAMQLKNSGAEGKLDQVKQCLKNALN